MRFSRIILKPANIQITTLFTNNYTNHTPNLPTSGIHLKSGGHFDFAHFRYFLAILHGDGLSHWIQHHQNMQIRLSVDFSAKMPPEVLFGENPTRLYS